MTQETGKFTNILNKMAAKRFSKKEKIVLLLVFFILTSIGFYYLKEWTNAIKNKGKIIEPIIPKTTIPRGPNISEQIKQTITETAAAFKKPEIRDPFLPAKDSNLLKPVAEEKKPVINLDLKGILWDRLVPSAIINSKVVEIGDIIYDKTVVDIEKDEVILMENGEIFILKLKKQ